MNSTNLYKLGADGTTTPVRGGGEFVGTYKQELTEAQKQQALNNIGATSLKELTAIELTAMNTAARMVMYENGVRLLRVYNNGTVVLLSLGADGKTDWMGGYGPKNLLDNSDFRNPVNQRGQTSYTGSGYSIDRWRAYHADTTHTITTSGIAVFATGVNPNIYQVFDLNVIDANKTYTAAVCDSAGNVYVQVMKPTTSAYAPVCIYISNGSFVFRITGVNTWRWAALYEGSYTADTLPPYVPKGYGAELDECMRYYQQSRNGSISADQSMDYIACIAVTGERLTSVDFIRPMRAIPTVTLYNNRGEAGIWKEWVSDANVTTMKAVYCGTQRFIPACTGSGFTVGKCYTGQFSASADL